MSKTYWKFGLYDEDSFNSGQYDTREEAEQAAMEAYAEDVNEFDSPKNNEKFSDYVWYYQVFEDTVEYEHYHGDKQEHGLTGSQLL